MCAEMPDLAPMLRQAGLRATQQRLTILSIILAADDHPNADELLARSKAVDDSVSLATIYRTLAALEEAGLIRRLSIENESARYESTPVLEHDHIIDIDTGEVIEAHSDEINRLRQQMVERLGYEIVSQHSVIRARKIKPD